MQNAKQQVALSSIAASAALTLAKGIVGLSTGSLAILSEAAHSLIDFAATLMTYFAVRVSDKPADAEASLRARQGRERLGAGRDGTPVPAVGRGDLGALARLRAERACGSR